MQEKPTVEMQYADPAVRRKAVMVLILLCVLGMAVLFLTLSHLDNIKEIARQDPMTALNSLKRLMILFLTCIVVSLSALAIYFWRLAAAVKKHDRFPPPGILVVSDTRVLRGQKAYRFGIAVKIVAVTCWFFSLLIPLIVWLLTKELLG